MRGWNRCKNSDFLQYAKNKDEIDEALYIHFLEVVFPHEWEKEYFLLGEPQTMDDQGRMLYMKFTNKNGKYYYEGLAYAKEDRDGRDGI